MPRVVRVGRLAAARQVAALREDPARARAMGEAGRRRVLERFDARVTTPALVDVLVEAHERFHAPRA